MIVKDFGLGIGVYEWCCFFMFFFKIVEWVVEIVLGVGFGFVLCCWLVCVMGGDFILWDLILDESGVCFELIFLWSCIF